MSKSFKTLIKSKPEGAVFFGDWHGDLNFAILAIERAVEKYPSIEVFYHVGDFGLGLGGKSFLDTVSGMMVSAGKVLVVTGGNHENWDLWDELTDNQTKPYVFAGEGLVLLPKLYSWVHAGLDFTSVGGANSVDRAWRNPRTTWWEQEIISETVIETLEKATTHSADILITHEASDRPVMPVQQMLDNPFQQMKWPYEDTVLSDAQRKLVSRALQAVSPRYHFHGHWHTPWVRDEDELVTVSLGANYASYAENAHAIENFSDVL